MTLLSQQAYNSRNPDKGRDIQYDIPPVQSQKSINQDRYARLWQRSLNSEPTRKKLDTDKGRPSSWSRYRSLLLKHGNLATGDFATLLNLSERAATASLRRYNKQGRIVVVDKIDHVSIWALPD